MAAPKGGYFGKILEVDLTSGKISTLPLEDDLARQYLGGTGLGAYLLYKHMKPGAAPLSPDNVLFVGVGPLNGTQCPGSRLSISFKSPFNNMYGHSFAGGPVPSEIKWAGWDGILIKGKSPKPVYLSIFDDKVELKDAAAHWGKDTYQADEDIKVELNDPEAKLLLIGPAGENLTPLAAVITDRFRAAGRSGGGAVMGSKNLKAIAVHGTKAVPIANVDAFNKIANEASDLCAANDRSPGFRAFGTAMSLDQNNHFTGSLVTKNYQSTYYPDISRLGAEEAERTFWKRHVSCPGCQIHCMKLGVIRGSELFEGLIAEGPEYESGTMEGPNLAMADFDAMMHLIEKCDALGLDNIGAGNVVGFTMELIQRGILKPEDIDGIDASWGNVEGASKLFDAIAYKQGKAGELLGLGVYDMAKKVGNGADKYCIAVKKQGMAAHDPRGHRSRMYTYALGPRGGAHTEGDTTAQLLERSFISSATLCYFVNATWKDRAMSMLWEMINPLTGWNMNKEEYEKIAKRQLTLQRAFSVREGGVSRADDTLPDRMFNEPLPEGPRKDAVVTREEMKKAQDEYYGVLGWDANGIPTEATLKAYGLDFALDSLKKK